MMYHQPSSASLILASMFNISIYSQALDAEYVICYSKMEPGTRGDAIGHWQSHGGNH